MQIAVVQFSHLSPDSQSMLSLQRVGMQPHRIAGDDLPEQFPEKFSVYQGFIIEGEFLSPSYLPTPEQAGMISFLKQQSQLGKPILGVGGGAQILANTGLIPGLMNDQAGMTVALSLSCAEVAPSYICLMTEYQRNAFTEYLTPKTLLAVTNNDAQRYFDIPPALLYEIQQQGLNGFFYCDEMGQIKDYSMQKIAAVSNKAGNVLALLPTLADADFESILRSMQTYITQGNFSPVAPLYYLPRTFKN